MISTFQWDLEAIYRQESFYGPGLYGTHSGHDPQLRTLSLHMTRCIKYDLELPDEVDGLTRVLVPRQRYC